jgi:hypothetical protein
VAVAEVVAAQVMIGSGNRNDNGRIAIKQRL